MGKFLNSAWHWLGNKDHRERLLAVVAVLALAGTLVSWVTGLFEGEPTTAPPPGGDTIIVTGGGAVSTGSGTAISTGDNSTVTINPGNTIEAEDWAVTEREGTLNAYTVFLSKYPDSKFSVDAWLRILATMPATGQIAALDDYSPETILLNQLKNAELAFNSPDILQYRRSETVELVLAPEGSGASASSQLSQDLSGEVQRSATLFSLKMQAILSGPDFEVTPKGPQARTVLGTRPTKWTWIVRPTTHGPDKPLTLEVYALLERGDTTLPPYEIRTFHKTILVEIGLWDRIVEIAEETKPVHAAVAGVGGTLTALLIWFWNRRKPSEKPKSHQIEVFLRRRRDTSGTDNSDDGDEPTDRGHRDETERM